MQLHLIPAMKESLPRPKAARAAVLALAVATLLALSHDLPWAAEDPALQTAAPKKKASSRSSQKAPTLKDLQALIEEQQRLIEQQRIQIEKQQALIERQQGDIEAQKKQLEDLEASLRTMSARLDELQQGVVSAESTKALEERLASVEKAAEKVPELPPDLVSAGDFPGSIRIPGTDGAIKFGGRIRFAGVFTLAPLGSEDRFVTNSIPVEDAPDDGKGQRTNFSANTSRFNIDLRTPAGASQMRAFIEGDFFGTNNSFRLRHAYAQYLGFIVGQTWSTFSDPEADVEDLDFEGISSENVIRQPLIRYWWHAGEDVRVAVAAETPKVSLTGGVGVNVVPDLVGRAIWSFKEIGHLQGAVVLRQIRGESDIDPDSVSSAFAWGVGLSGVVPFRYFDLTDRFIFQLNGGVGVARYINDLSSLGGQDAAFDPGTGDLVPLQAAGWYVAYEHMWKEWKTASAMNLRSSLIWSAVTERNEDFQPDDAYHQTNRLSFNVVFSPISRIDVGVQYVYGTRQNKDGAKGSSDQVQVVGIFRF